MQANKDNQDVIHRIDPESSEEISNRFDHLVQLLETGTDQEILGQVDGFHHSDLADAFGLLSGNLRKRLLDLLKKFSSTRIYCSNLKITFEKR